MLSYEGGPLEPYQACHLRRIDVSSCLSRPLVVHCSFTYSRPIRQSGNQRVICDSLANIVPFVCSPAIGLGQPDNRPQSSSSHSPGLTLNLSSNNPFRNRAASPNSFSPPPPHSPFDDPPHRPVSRNPFLDPFNPPQSSQQQRSTSPDKMASTSKKATSPTAEELFVSFHPPWNCL